MPERTTTTTSIERLLTYPEAAELLGVTARTVWNLVHRGELRAVRFGGSVRIDPADLRAFVESAKNSGEAVECGRDETAAGNAQ